MKNLNLYLVRHGQTEWNVQDRMQGTKNSELTQAGVQGALVTGDSLKEKSFVGAYSSDLKRAILTRDYILSENKHQKEIPTFELPSLREIHYGTWEGEKLSNLATQPEFDIYINDPEAYEAKTNEGETYFTALARIESGLREIVKNTKQDSGDILVISHGAILRLLLCVLGGGSIGNHRDEEISKRILNTSISIVNYNGDDEGEGKFSIQLLNDVSHL